MPHDKNGIELKVGDEVVVRCKVVSVSPNPDYCNTTVETVEPMYPGKTRTCVTLNCRQVEKVIPQGGVCDARCPAPPADMLTTNCGEGGTCGP